MAEPENLVLEHLRAIRGEMTKMADWMHTMSVEMTAIRQHLAGVVTIQEHDHGDIASIKDRLNRIERRLDLVD
jgi:ACT domain-containing protein